MLFTADLAGQAIERRNAVHDFELTATMPGAFARVRMVHLNDTAALQALPDHLLRRVLGMVNDVDSKEANHALGERQNADGSLNVDAVMTLMAAERKIADAYCLAGFVEPRLVLTQDEIDLERDADDKPVLMEAIHPADRRRFLEWCTGRHAEAAATVEPFPDGPDADVAAGGPGGVDGGAAESAAAPAGDGAE